MGFFSWLKKATKVAEKIPVEVAESKIEPSSFLTDKDFQMIDSLGPYSDIIKNGKAMETIKIAAPKVDFKTKYVLSNLRAYKLGNQKGFLLDGQNRGIAQEDLMSLNPLLAQGNSEDSSIPLFQIDRVGICFQTERPWEGSYSTLAIAPPTPTGKQPYLKVMLIREISENPDEDGYEIVDRFFSVYPEVKASISAKSENSMCCDLIRKLEKEGYAVWNLIEVLSFGDLVMLCEVYDQNTGGKNEDLFRCLFAVRCLRNAAAHNNCLLNSMRAPYTRKIKPSMFLNHFASTIPGIKATSREKKMSNPVIHDFVGLLFVYDKIVTSPRTREHFADELHQLFDERMVKRKEYFQKNEVLLSSYSFVIKAINQLYPLE